MSTKIYHGYTLPLMTVKELTEFTKSFRKKVEGKAIELLTKFLANEVAEMVDDLGILNENDYCTRHVLFEKEIDLLMQERKLEEKGIKLEEKDKVKLSVDAYTYRSIYTVTYRKAEERYKKIQRTQHRDPDVDFDCSACFIPLEDKIVALFYSEQKELQELWEACEEVSYYGYWDNGIPDEDVSKEEWKKREQDWEEALPGIGIPLENGLNADFIKGFPGLHVVSLENIVKQIPPLEQRAKRVSEELVLDRKFKELLASDPSEEPNRMSVYHATRRWMRTDQGKQALQDEMKNVRPLLVETITKAHLLTKLNKLKTGEILGISEG
ncbi:hypothetical protein ACFVS2_25370 [Brevibacillus sp. NPDC058079]|uniref:hypothetical protein n=1 Tax=Brevibacillus sp. NPDC058079 TaxID=3346330 RepID=UPI0036EEEF44